MNKENCKNNLKNNIMDKQGTDRLRLKSKFVSYKIALTLKEKGFIGNCLSYYNQDGCFKWNEPEPGVPTVLKCLESQNAIFGLKGFRTDAPTIEQSLSWLREEKNLHVVCPYYKDKGFYFYVQEVGDAARIVSSFDDSDDCFNSYEAAAIAGIEYVLDNLI